MLLLSFPILFYTNANSQVGTKNYTVKLYSAGVVVGTWQAHQIGTGDRETISFYIGSRTYPRKVTIAGTFSIEELD